MAQYTYITLNDGTKWRVKGNVQPQAGSGPYRYVTTSGESSTAKSAESATKKNTSSTAQSAAAAQAAADAEAKKAKARREAELEAERKERERREKIAAINSSKEQELKFLGENYGMQKEMAKTAMNDNMRQLYIAYMQGLRGIPQQSALWGAGGEIESIKNRSRINYEDNRAKENRNYAGILGEIQRKYDDDLRDLEARYLQKLLNI